MDAVSDLLTDVRARGAVFQRTIMRAPWALRIVGGAPLTLAMMLRGHAWIVPDTAPPVRVGTGEIAVVRGDVPYTVADSPTTAPTRVVTDDDYCTPAFGPLDDDAPVLLSGAFERRGELSEHLLHALPAVLTVPAVAHPPAAVVADEIAADRPGRQLVLDRMLDLMLVAALRHWFAAPHTDAPAWCRALDDPIVGTALRLLHDTPDQPWTVAGLAAKAGVSRAALARRFTTLVGEPPMAYLANWRVALAADLLDRTDHTVATIARKVGYANAFALSVAFKRLRGTRPSDHRRALADRA
ncbi:AraC family transcriptional regulator [Saccharothrix violaceirubra]|uniref:AraC-like DNA-binding protein n=1 Tax=Saccharothrix violaceirubra TaxID=413306 RepID=A0A7W7T3M6_9PSEU|nr:AraC family transcriptional regulator [Saccharothrix violaceirubra]MBB4965901.1 AraC-like DNA-binding protein [Saccharothrix violaceirubra]